MATAAVAVSVSSGRLRDAAALASGLGDGRAADKRGSRPGSAASALQFAPTSGTPASWSSRTAATTANKAVKMMMEEEEEEEEEKRGGLADWTAKLLVLPLVGASLCGALTLLVGVHWVEAVRRQELSSYYDYCYYRCYRYGGAPSLASLWALLSVDGSEQESDADGVASDNGGDDRQQQQQQARSPSARPAKRQRSGSTGDGSEADEYALVPRQPKPSSPLTAVSPRPTTAAAAGNRRRRRRRVFIWDLDETLVLFASLYTGSFAQTHGKEEAPGVALGEQMMTFLLAMLERHFFFGDLHDTDVDHISCAEGARCSNCRRLRSAASASASSVLAQDTGELQGEAEDPREAERKTRYRRIRDIYEQRGHVDFLHDDQSEWFAIRAALVHAIDGFSTGWLQEARQVLSLIEAVNTGGESRLLRSVSTVSLDGAQEDEDGLDADPMVFPEDEETSRDGGEEGDDDEEEEGEEVENVNVLVTNTQLVPALCKCLVYELDAFFPIERVYSSAKVHKYRCFEAIMAKYRAEPFGDGDEDVAVEFVAIGDGLEEEQVSLALGLEFHKIRSLADLRRLRYDLQLVPLPPVNALESRSQSSSASAGTWDSLPATARIAVPTMSVAVDTQEQ